MEQNRNLLGDAEKNYLFLDISGVPDGGVSDGGAIFGRTGKAIREWHHKVNEAANDICLANPTADLYKNRKELRAMAEKKGQLMGMPTHADLPDPKVQVEVVVLGILGRREWMRWRDWKVR